MTMSEFEIPWTVFPEMGNVGFSNAQLSRERRAHQSAKRIFSRYAKMLQGIEDAPRET